MEESWPGCSVSRGVDPRKQWGIVRVQGDIVFIYADIDVYAFQTELVFETLARIHASSSNKIERKELTMAMTNVMCEMPHSLMSKR